MSGGTPGDSGNYFFDSLNTNGTINTTVAHDKSKYFVNWTIWNDSANTIKFRFSQGSSNDWIEVLAGEKLEIRILATGYDEQSGTATQAFRVLGIE